MKTYKDFEKTNLGASDYATLILVGCGEEGLKLDALHFGGDGTYGAYVVDDPEAEIGGHYTKVYECERWLKIYDDYNCVAHFKADTIEVYRAAEFGCIIRLVGNAKIRQVPTEKFEPDVYSTLKDE